jgi:hypothetical protein
MNQREHPGVMEGKQQLASLVLSRESAVSLSLVLVNCYLEILNGKFQK